MVTQRRGRAGVVHYCVFLFLLFTIYTFMQWIFMIVIDDKLVCVKWNVASLYLCLNAKIVVKDSLNGRMQTLLSGWKSGSKNEVLLVRVDRCEENVCHFCTEAQCCPAGCCCWPMWETFTVISRALQFLPSFVTIILSVLDIIIELINNKMEGV